MNFDEMHTVERIKYWSKRWENEDTPWHLKDVNKFLYHHFNKLKEIKEGACRIFVPLCGKTFDLKWIYDQGHQVVGVDGILQPILDFFQEHKLAIKKGEEGDLEFYETEDGRIRIYHCNFFALNPLVCGKFDGIWDRGSLVAMLPEDRTKYANLLMQFLKDESCYLLNIVQYDQNDYPGPPYSVSDENIQFLYGDKFNVQILETDNTNADPTSPASAKMRWNVDVCHEVILLLKLRSN